MAKRYDLALPPRISDEQLIPALNERLRLIDNLLGRLDAGQTAAATSSQSNGFHTTRVSALPATRLDVGTLFWETDRNALYEVQQDGAARVWVYRTGTMRAAYSSRPSDLGSYDAGFLFFATDRTVTYRWDGSVWSYDSGTMRDTLANIPTLGADDVGFLFFATDYAHTFRWGGAAWTFAPGDEGSGFFRDFAIAPAGAEWAVCDGSATDYVASDATVHAITPPDLTGGVYRRGAAAYSSTVHAASGGTISGDTSDESAGTPSGTNDAPVFTGTAGSTGSTSAGTPAGAVSAPTFTGGLLGWSSTTITNGGGAPQLVLTGPTSTTPTGTNSAPSFTGSAMSGHTHTFTPVGTVSAPNFTGDPLADHHHDMSGGTVAFASDPVANIEVLVCFRR